MWAVLCNHLLINTHALFAGSFWLLLQKLYGLAWFTRFTSLWTESIIQTSWSQHFSAQMAMNMLMEMLHSRMWEPKLSNFWLVYCTCAFFFHHLSKGFCRHVVSILPNFKGTATGHLQNFFLYLTLVLCLYHFALCLCDSPSLGSC